MHLTLRGAVPAALIAAAALAAASCAGGPAPQSGPPAWTMETPSPDGTYTYFVGYSDGTEATLGQTADAATAGLIAEIMRYIGVTISAESSATAKATLDSFQTDLVQTVKQTSTSRVAGFQVAEKYTAQRRDGITVFILGRYATKDLEAEKKRIAAVFQEKYDAVAKPEAEGKSLLSDGDAIAAARKFIEAAAAASGADIENAAIKFERNLNAAKGAVALVTIEKTVDRLETAAGTGFSKPFTAVVKVGGRGVSGVPVTVGYQSRLANGRMTTKSVNLVSAADGSVSFDHPIPDFVGKATLTMRLDLSSALEPLYGIPDKFMSMVAGLEDEVASKRVAFEYSVVSKARTVPTAVFVVDLDKDGNAVSGATTSALLGALVKAGFMAGSAPLSASDVAGKDDAAVLAAARAALAGKAERFAYGTTRVAAVKDDKTQKIATVAAEVKVVELATGRILYAVSKQGLANAATERDAIESARRLLGQKTIGEDMAANLP